MTFEEFDVKMQFQKEPLMFEQAKHCAKVEEHILLLELMVG